MKINKKAMNLIVAVAVALTSSQVVQAKDMTTPIYVNNEVRDSGFNIQGVTYVPLRSISEMLGATVNWDVKTNSATITKGDTTIVQKVGDTSAKVNGKVVNSGASALLRDGKTIVPLRFVSKNLGVDVVWDSVNRAVQITAEGVPSKEQALKDYYKSLVSMAKPITSFAMKPVSTYTTMDKVPGSVNRKRYKEIAFTNDLPIQINHSTNVLEIDTTKLKNGLEVLEVTLSVVNRDIPNPIIYATKKTGLMLEVNDHLPGETETIIEMGEGTYIIKQKYYMPDKKLNGVVKNEIEGVAFTNRGGEYGEIVKTLVVRKKL